MNYKLERLGVVMVRDESDPREAWGVLNPVSARGPDGELYLFPRLVAQGNYSRIGRARVVFAAGRPTGVERLGIALEPEESWESKGVEDPRITFLPALGLAAFDGDLDGFDNKDAAYFPEAVRTPAGGTGYALLHRPANEERPGIWVSFAEDPGKLARLTGHTHVAGPEQPWEVLKIGAGPPPVRVPEGWLLLHHGVSGGIKAGLDLQPDVRYCAGAMVLDAHAVWRVVWRSTEPLLAPETRDEREGIVANVVFPTAIDGSDVYYGMADARIGAARLSL